MGVDLGQVQDATGVTVEFCQLAERRVLPQLHAEAVESVRTQNLALPLVPHQAAHLPPHKAQSATCQHLVYGAVFRDHA